MLFYKKKVIDPSSSFNVGTCSSIDLIVKGIGGGGETYSGIIILCVFHVIQFNTNYSELSVELLDECVSCGTHADVYCDECKSSRCGICNDQWHKHPKRKHHKTRVCACYNDSY